MEGADPAKLPARGAKLYNGGMGFRSKGNGRKSGPAKDDRTALKIRLRGKDNSPLSMQEIRDGLMEAARQLTAYEPGYRVKFATLYLTMVDDDGDPVRINDANELDIFPYKTAADEHGI